MKNFRIKTLVISIILLTANYIYAADFKPGVSAGAIFSNAAVQQLMSAGRYFILVIFFALLAKNMFKLISGQGSPDWFGLLAKFAIIFLLYNNAVFAVTTFTNKIIVSTATTDSTKVSEAFSRLDVALVELAMGNPEQISPKKKDPGITDSIKDTFLSLSRIFSFQMIMSMILSVTVKGLMTIALMTKYLMIDIFWPIFFQLVVVGFVFAVPFASFEGGMDSIKKFGINMIEVAMWPIIYSLAFNLTVSSMVEVVDSFVNLIPVATNISAVEIAATAVAKVLADLPLLANLVAHLVFLIGLGFLTPLFCRMIVRNESVGIAASALTYSTGSQLMNMATQAGGMAGHALASTGKSMMGMTSKGAAEAAKGASGAAGAAGSAVSSGGSSGVSASSSGGSSGGGSGGGSESSGTGSASPESSGGSKITSDLAGDGGGSGGRAAHGGKGFYNAPNLTKSENQAMSKLSGNPEAKAEFGKLQGMRKDGFNEKAIDNQISNINSKFGTNLKKSGEK
ncbi:MAG: hypothetical protein RBT69_10690 [Spirochaetia bacterium]|nr:hypothetical protein [Spirochaetia bacterium]